jgi:hypothetical protein
MLNCERATEGSMKLLPGHAARHLPGQAAWQHGSMAVPGNAAGNAKQVGSRGARLCESTMQQIFQKLDFFSVCDCMGECQYRHSTDCIICHGCVSHPTTQKHQLL